MLESNLSGWLPHIGDALAPAGNRALQKLQQLAFRAHSDLGLVYLVPQTPGEGHTEEQRVENTLLLGQFDKKCLGVTHG